MHLLDRLADLGSGPADPPDERLRHGTLIFASVLITLISVIWVATYLAYGYPTSAAIPALYQLTTVVGLVVLVRTRRFGVFRTTQLAKWPGSPTWVTTATSTCCSWIPISAGTGSRRRSSPRGSPSPDSAAYRH